MFFASALYIMQAFCRFYKPCEPRGEIVNRLSDVVLENADALLSATKSIDFNKVLNHDVAEVKKLKGALKSLQISGKRLDESLDKYASKPIDGSSGSNESFDSLDDLPPLDDMDMAELEAADGSASTEAPFGNKDEIMAALAVEGLDGRAGMVYNSLSDSRTLPFGQVHHRRGVPRFDVVVAPDFAPVSGMHGVFISTSEIMSIILPSDNASADWQVLKRKPFNSSEEMIDYLSLISAGFDLP